MHDNPLVSVIIPCYNAEKWVADAINGILRQTYSPIEIIVIDDGSTDGSLDVIRSFGDRVRYETGPNRGGSAARNRGFALSRGEYVMFHDADDWISEETIARLVEGIEGTENTLVWCDWYIYKETPEGPSVTPGWYTQTTPKGVDHLLDWFEGWHPVLHAILWPRQVIVNIGGWDERLKQEQDMDVYARALIHGVTVKKVMGATAYWRHASPNAVHLGRTSASMYSRFEFINKMEAALTEQDRLRRYEMHLARLYIDLATRSAFLDWELSLYCEKRALDLVGLRAYSDGSFLHRILCSVFSLSFKERWTQRLARLGIGRKVRKDALRRASR